MSDRTLAEVDGLLAAFIYLDHTEPSSHKNLTCTNNLPKGRTAIPINTVADTQSCSVHDDIRALDLAWASARAISYEMQMLWDTFVEFSRVLDVAVINNLRSGYEDAKGLRYAGVFAYRNTLTGLRPNKLAKVFALCSLSYVTHRLLRDRGRLLQDGFLTGIHMWRDSLEDEDERRAFNQLSSHLWSEGQNHHGSMNLDSKEPSHYFTHTLQHDKGTSLSPTKHRVNPFDQQSSANYTQQAQQHPYPQGTPWKFDLPCESDTLSLLLANGESTKDLGAYTHGLESSTDLATDAPSVYNAEHPTEHKIWSDLGSVHSLDFNVPGMLGFTHGRFNTSPHYEPDDRSLVGLATSADSLQTTSIYMTIREFIHHDGQFWFQLAGRGLVSKDIASCQSWSQERWAQKKHIRTSYVQKLLSAGRTKDKISSGIISIVDTFVDWGFLRSIENIEFYMEGLADLLFNDKRSCQEFGDWIRASSGSAKGKLHQCPDCTYSSTRKHNTTRHRALIHAIEGNERSKKRLRAIGS